MFITFDVLLILVDFKLKPNALFDFDLSMWTNVN